MAVLAEGRGVKELFRSNDPVRLSWAEAMLAGAGIEVLVLDGHTSVLEGSISAIPRRLMVADDDYGPARRVLDEADPAFSSNGS
jgi:hypothetical protein